MSILCIMHTRIPRTQRTSNIMCFLLFAQGQKKGYKMIQILVGNSLAPGTQSLDHPGPKPKLSLTNVPRITQMHPNII